MTPSRPMFLRTLLASFVLGACTASSENTAPVAHELAFDRSPASIIGNFDSAGMIAEFPDTYSWDSVAIGSTALYEFETNGAVTCRQHQNAIDMWYMSPHGNVKFHLPGPQVFVSYRAGSYLGMAKAIYKNSNLSQGTVDGHRYEFSGRYNALCRSTTRTNGVFTYTAQAVVA
jgi:hypothetical protein